MDCQSHFFALVDLFMAEEAAIARMHLVVSILKLRPSGTFNLAAYSCIKGHVVIFPQNPTLLLTLLLSSTLALHDVRHISWVR